jgi:hypothetical protein
MAKTTQLVKPGTKMKLTAPASEPQQSAIQARYYLFGQDIFGRNHFLQLSDVEHDAARRCVVDEMRGQSGGRGLDLAEQHCALAAVRETLAFTRNIYREMRWRLVRDACWKTAQTAGFAFRALLGRTPRKTEAKPETSPAN